MKQITSRQKYLLYATLALFLISLTLITASQVIQTQQPQRNTSKGRAPIWQPFPTRGLTATPTPTVLDIYSTLQLAITQRDYDTADLIIKQALALYSDNTLLLRAQARMAFLRKDFDTAEKIMWDIIGKDPENALNWIFISTILTQAAKTELAEQAMAVALTLDPSLTGDLFLERWRIAFKQNDPQKLTALADEYYLLYPDDPLSAYYNASALLASGHTNIALNLLVETLDTAPPSSSLLWYGLGRAYLQRQSYSESATAFENAIQMFEAGDKSLLLIGEKPLPIIEDDLADAYMGSNQCSKAELLYRLLADITNDISYTNLITSAVTCQTPTPTPTHWMLSLQPTLKP